MNKDALGLHSLHLALSVEPNLGACSLAGFQMAFAEQQVKLVPRLPSLSLSAELGTVCRVPRVFKNKAELTVHMKYSSCWCHYRRSMSQICLI